MIQEIGENGLRVLKARYLRRNDHGETIEMPDELFERVARAVSEAELLYGNAADARRWEERFGQMMSAFDFLPNSPALMNAGTVLGQLSACFVLPIEDTMQSIFATLRDAALIQRTGGGTGFSFSKLRPEGDPVRTTGGVSSGPVSFMKIYDSATGNIKLGGRRREPTWVFCVWTIPISGSSSAPSGTASVCRTLTSPSRLRPNSWRQAVSSNTDFL